MNTITQFEQFKDIVVNGKTYCEDISAERWTSKEVIGNLQEEFVKLREVISEIFQETKLGIEQRSYLFHLKLAMFLSLVAQKRCFITEAAKWQVKDISKLPMSISSIQSIEIDPAKLDISSLINILIITDETQFIFNMIEKLKSRGLKTDIHMFPSEIDQKTLPTFLSMNENTILVENLLGVESKKK